MRGVVTFLSGFFLSLLLTAIVYLFLVANTVIITEDMTNKQLYCEILIFEDIQPDKTFVTY